MCQEQNRTADTRISEIVVEPCVSNGRQLNEFNRLISLRSPSIYRSTHIALNGFGKAVAKSDAAGRRLHFL
jgi:hypothetical protein